VKRLLQRIKLFFFPPAGTPRWVRVLPYAVLGVFTLILLTAAAYAWEYTNSPPFCGTTCHTMPPEYTSYQVSPHARIACVDCHIGRGFIATRISRKAGDLKHVYKMAFHAYEFPLEAEELRPARETCELCHNPEKFSDDSLRVIRHYGNDTANTPQDIYLSLKTGGGSQRQGLGKGIHWHIENPIYYLPTDSTEQTIPYVKYQASDGTVKEYIDIESGIDPASIQQDQLKEMDCITCHNRITHLVATPEDTVDKLIETGQISSDIPDVRRQAVTLYSGIFDTTEMGLNSIAGLEGYYQTYYPEYYAGNQAKISQAIKALQEAYSTSVYPEQNSDWSSHPNNIGHKNSPGCFRCHDGKHLDSENKAIRLECNLCHSIPAVASADETITQLEINRGSEPQSHLNESWMSMHHLVYDETCKNCHTMDDPGGTSNTSFCSNSACHGSSWKYGGFDAPKLKALIQSQIDAQSAAPPEGSKPLTYNDSIGPLLSIRCSTCHGENGQMGLNVTTYASLMAGSQSGPVIVTGDPQNSLLVKVLSGTTPHDSQTPGLSLSVTNDKVNVQSGTNSNFGQLTPEELQLIISWIKAGTPEK
jgi:nitrate/TMAO reductase-like tetraheme cytochrome c subunit